MKKKIIVTGGAGFIGSALVRYIIQNTADEVVNLDKLTYAANLDSLAEVGVSPRYQFRRVDICDRAAVEQVMLDVQPDVVVHLAAESHVDRSIDGPAAFIQTNIVGTYTLLEAARSYRQQRGRAADGFRFHHVSTDEVYGDLEDPEELFTEASRYQPNSPYSASKASSDHLVRAWGRTFGLPFVMTNCSNNYGPYQFPEKLIPVIINSALDGKPLPVYGDGAQIRDWLFVDDHVEALYAVMSRGQTGETYNIGGHNEMRNIEVVRMICTLLDELATSKPSGINRYEDLISFVKDRPGHDRRYAIDATRIGEDLSWKPRETFASGLRKTVQWYLENRDWGRRNAA